MIKIQVGVYSCDGVNLFTCVQVAWALITDVSTNRCYKLHFTDSYGIGSELEKKYQDSQILPKDTMAPPLYVTDKNYDDFIKAYTGQFDSKNFCCVSKNCADAVNFMLDYFFPEPYCTNAALDTYRVLCSAFCLATLGIFSCLPSPCCMMTPPDVLRKAKALSHRYGESSIESKTEFKADNVIATATQPLLGRP